MKEKIKKIASKIMSVLIALLFLTGVTLFVAVLATKGDNVPNIFGYSFLKVTTTSMVPSYSVGDLLAVKSVDAGKLVVGDAISFYSDDPNILNIPNTHRIVKIIESENAERTFITKGDNNSEQDEYPVSESRLIGKVEHKIKGINKIIGFLQNDMAFFVLILVPIIVIAVFEVRNVFRIANEKDDSGNDKKDDDDNQCREQTDKTDKTEKNE